MSYVEFIIVNSHNKNPERKRDGVVVILKAVGQLSQKNVLKCFMVSASYYLWLLLIPLIISLNNMPVYPSNLEFERENKQ